ncbi:MAG: histidine kinase [Friedmanniella sp.]
MDQDMTTGVVYRQAVRGLADLGGDNPIVQLVDRCAEVSRTSERLRLLLRENEALAEELALPSLHCRIAEAASHLVPTRAAALAVLTPEGQVRQLVQRRAAEDCAVAVLVPTPGLELLTQLLGPLRPGQVFRIQAPGPVLPEPWREDFLAVPVHFRRDVLAVLLLAPPPTGLDAEDEDVLLSLAVAAGTAIENARLYDEARRRQQWLQEAAEVGNSMLALATEREAVGLIAQSVQKLADAELVTAWTPGPSHDLLLGTVVMGDGSEEFVGCRISREDSLATEILGSGCGQQLCSTDRPDCAWMAAIDRAGIGPVMVVPFSGAGGSRGLLLAGRRHGRPAYSASDVDMAETFASHMGIALDRIAARTAQQRVSLLEDRERIARDLHDHVIQSLFATGLKVQCAERLSQEEAVRPRLAEVVQDIDGTIRQLRTTIFQLGDRVAPGCGLRSAVLDVLQDVAPVLPFEPEVEFDGPVDTAADSALVDEVVAVVREAATNCGKHARASRLLVAVQVAAGRLTLLVQDDGVGLGGATRRSGLDNLKQRAVQLGGSLTLDVPAGGGTRLCWSVPLHSG